MSGGITMELLERTFCDRCMTKTEEILALMDLPDPFFASAAALGETECERCQRKIDEFFGLDKLTVEPDGDDD